MIHLKKAMIASVVALSLSSSSANAVPSPTQDQVGGLTEFTNMLSTQSITSLKSLYDLVVGVGQLMSHVAQAGSAPERGPKMGSNVPSVDKPMQVGTSGQRTPLHIGLGAPQMGSHVHKPGMRIGIGLVTPQTGSYTPIPGPKQEVGSLNASETVKYVRYLYSPRWGWLDTRHFTAAADYATKNSAFKSLLMGTLKEVDQLSNEEKSSFSYEDRVSNALGVYFIKEYSMTEENKSLAFQTVLLKYLTELGFDEKPTTSSPNFNQLPKTDADVATTAVVKNYTYEPSYTTQARDHEIDQLIEDFLYWLP